MKQPRSRIRKQLDFFQLSHTEHTIPDERHPHRRRFLPPYQTRLRYVRDGWLYYCLFILFFEIALPFIATTILFNTFLSFAFLEETEYPEICD